MYEVIVGGSPEAVLRWPSRTYQRRSSARRRIKQITDAHDSGVATIWLLVSK